MRQIPRFWRHRCRCFVHARWSSFGPMSWVVFKLDNPIDAFAGPKRVLLGGLIRGATVDPKKMGKLCNKMQKGQPRTTKDTQKNPQEKGAWTPLQSSFLQKEKNAKTSFGSRNEYLNTEAGPFYDPPRMSIRPERPRKKNCLCFFVLHTIQKVGSYKGGSCIRIIGIRNQPCPIIKVLEYFFDISLFRDFHEANWNPSRFPPEHPQESQRRRPKSKMKNSMLSRRDCCLETVRGTKVSWLLLYFVQFL